MYKSFIAPLSTILLVGAAAPAFAQDEAPAKDWTGVYVGGSIGMSWQPNYDRETLERLRFDTNGDGVFNNNVNTPAGANAFSPGFCRGRALGATPGTCGGDKDKRLAFSGHIGYDMQMGNFVVGAVVEAGRSMIGNSVSGFSTTPASYVLSRRVDWDGSARLRAGYALPTNTLVYGTGGLAYAKIKNSFATTNTANSFVETRGKDEDEWGWTAGGGVEQKITDNFSLGVQYLYTRLKTEGYTVRAGQGAVPSTTNPFVITPAGYTDMQRTNDKFEHNSVRVTASYRF